MKGQVTHIGISFLFNRFDNWHGESFSVFVNGFEIIRRYIDMNEELTHVCINGKWTNSYIPMNAFVELGQNVDDVTISFKSTIDKDSKGSSYEIRNLMVYGWNECPEDAVKCFVENNILIVSECKSGSKICKKDTPLVNTLNGKNEFDGWTDPYEMTPVANTICDSKTTILNGEDGGFHTVAQKTFKFKHNFRVLMAAFDLYTLDSWNYDIFAAKMNGKTYS